MDINTISKRSLRRRRSSIKMTTNTKKGFDKDELHHDSCPEFENKEESESSDNQPRYLAKFFLPYQYLLIDLG